MPAQCHAGSRRLKQILLACVFATSAVALSHPGQATDVREMPAPPPPMGWSSWNVYGNAIDETLIEGQADALKALNSQLSPGTHPYNHVNIDEGWWHGSAGRDASGAPFVDPTYWTNGSMVPVANYIHADGLLAGIYTDAGPSGCGDGGGSAGYYAADMLRFAQWGYDYVKVDYCGADGSNYDPQQTYTEVALALENAEKETARQMYLSLCDWGLYGISGYADTSQGPWYWAAGVGFLPSDIWRASGDITPNVGSNAYVTFQQVLDNFHASIHPAAQHTGYYNDLDMMVVGVNGLDNDPSNPVQSQAHMDLWAVAASPLILGTDVNTLLQNQSLLDIVSNPRVIGIDQDPRGLDAIQVAAPAPGLEIWSRLLAGSGRRAVVMLNTTTLSAMMSVHAAELGFSTAAPIDSLDVWTGLRRHKPNGIITEQVPPQGARMFIVTGTDLLPTAAPAVASGNQQTATVPAKLADGAAPVNQGPTPLDITYSNGTGQTLFNMMSVNGGSPQVVAFPRTGGIDRTVSVIANLNKGAANTVSFQATTQQPLPTVSAVSVVAGPVPAFQPVYYADAPDNTLAGTAVLQLCTTCSDGYDIGYVGNGSGNTLTFNNVMAKKAGLATILVAYLNGDGQDRTATISVNGQAGVTYTFPRTKDWATVMILPVKLQLQQGANAITFSNSSYYAPNFSALGAPR